MDASPLAAPFRLSPTALPHGPHDAFPCGFPLRLPPAASLRRVLKTVPCGFPLRPPLTPSLCDLLSRFPLAVSLRLPLRLRCVGGGRKGGVSFKAVSVEGRLTNRVKWLWLSEPPRRCLPFPPDLRRTHLSPLGRRPTSRLIYSSFRLVLSAPPRLYVTPAARPTSC